MMDNHQWIDFFTDAALAELANARRYLENKSALGWVCSSIRSGLMMGIEVWLRRHDYDLDKGNGWQSTRSQFFRVAPEDLGSIVTYCLGAVVMHEGPETRIENDELIYRSPNVLSEQWQSTAKKLIVRAEEVLEILISDVKKNRDEE